MADSLSYSTRRSSIDRPRSFLQEPSLFAIWHSIAQAASSVSLNVQMECSVHQAVSST